MPSKLSLLSVLVAAALASAVEHHPSPQQGAREHVEIAGPTGPLPRYTMTQPPTTMRGRAEMVFTAQGTLSPAAS